MNIGSKLTKKLVLSSREIEVLHLIGKGLSDKEMSTRLGIAPRTINTHLVNLYKKIKILSGETTVNRIKAIQFGITEGILPSYYHTPPSRSSNTFIWSLHTSHRHTRTSSTDMCT